MACLGRIYEQENKPCRFAKNCKDYTKTSYTCTHMGGLYCGAFRSKIAKPEVVCQC